MFSQSSQLEVMTADANRSSQHIGTSQASQSSYSYNRPSCNSTRPLTASATNYSLSTANRNAGAAAPALPLSRSTHEAEFNRVPQLWWCNRIDAVLGINGRIARNHGTDPFLDLVADDCGV